MKLDKPPSWLWVILLVTALVFAWLGHSTIFADKSATEANRPYVSLSECQLTAYSPPYMPHTQVLGSLVECLEYYESGGNLLAVGKAGEKGVLQFMPSTFQHFCVEKYHYRNDIWDPDIQRACCADMLKDNLIHHWTTKNLCVHIDA